jgi:hypothetical protein
MHLYSWYSCDWTVARFLKRDRANKRSYYLDLYPERKFMERDSDASDVSESKQIES